MSKVKIQGNASGTGTFTIQAPNSNSDRVLSLPDGAGEILTDGTSYVPQKGVPIFHTTMSATQSVSSSTWTKVQFNTETIDSDGSYDTSTYRYTPQIAGWYSFGVNLYEGSTVTRMILSIARNGNYSDQRVVDLSGSTNFSKMQFGGTALYYMNGTTDYVEVYGWVAASGGPIFSSGDGSNFHGFLVRAD